MFNRYGPKLLGLIALALISGTAHAQYKWIDEQGRIGYGDLIPPGNVKILKGPRGFKKMKKRHADRLSGSAADSLPFELRKIANRFPVTLYSTTVCAPCDLARQHLKRRGIPYTEKIVSSARDVEAFSALGFDSGTGLPVITAGADKRIGYHAVRWDDMLTSAGYPKESRLPANFENPPAEALAAATQQPNVPAEAVNVANSRRSGAQRQQRVSPSGRAQQEEPTIRF